MRAAPTRAAACASASEGASHAVATIVSLAHRRSRSFDGVAVGPTRTRRRRSGRSGTAEHRLADLHAQPRQADYGRRAARKARKSAAADDGTENRRHHPCRRHLAQLLHRHPLGQQRAADRRGHPQDRQPLHRHARVRGRSHARAARRRAGRAYRRGDLAGGREPLRTGRDGPQGARHRVGANRHRGDVEVRLRRQHRRRGAGDEDRQRDRRSSRAAA